MMYWFRRAGSLFFHRAAGLEHFEHAVGDEESADDIAGSGAMAMTPSTVANSLLRSPTMTIAPTTAMASRALVRASESVEQGRDVAETSKPMKQPA